MTGVLCVGRVYCDLVFTGVADSLAPGTEVYADKLSLHCGGGAGITALYLSALGHRAELCASLPGLPFTEQVKDELHTNDVGTSACTVDSTADPQITVVVTNNTDRSFLTRRPAGALPVNYPKLIEQLVSTGDIAHMHIGELATLVDHPDLIETGRLFGLTISTDCAWDETLFTKAVDPRLIGSVDLFLPNEAELERLSDSGITDSTAPLTVVKQGKMGARMVSGEQRLSVSAQIAECIDPTGAGDAFNAGFIHAWLQRQSLEACLLSGNKSGAMAVSGIGGGGTLHLMRGNTNVV